MDNLFNKTKEAIIPKVKVVVDVVANHNANFMENWVIMLFYNASIILTLAFKVL